MNPNVVMSIAGSDPSAGAGIQADLKSFSFLNIHGVTVVSCVTSQNTRRVTDIHRIPLEIIESQIDILFEDFSIKAVKTGLLYDEEIIRLVSKKLSDYHMLPVVDPVMVATSGDIISQNNYVAAFIKYLLPQSFILTANISEASVLSGMAIETIEDVKESCKKLYDLGSTNVLIKGGHLGTVDAVDVFYDGKKLHTFSLPRIPNKKAHGSGCSLSAIIAGLLAQGELPVAAVKKAKYIIWSMMYDGYTIGKGADVLNHSCDAVVPFNVQKQQVDTWVELHNAVEQLISFLPPSFVPEVGMNFVYALENATSFEEICAVDGRIIYTKDHVKRCGTVSFGVSRHVASIVLSALSFDKNCRSVLNIRYSKQTLELCKKAGFRLGFFDRKNEPKNVSSTMEWGTTQAITDLGFVPDIIYDIGGVGKEPMIRILGKNPKDVLLKTKKLLNIHIR